MKSGDGDHAARIMQPRNDFAQGLDRVVNRPAEIARVQIPTLPTDCYFDAERTAQRLGNRRTTGARHRHVRQHGHVCLAPPGTRKKGGQAATAGLLVAFESAPAR